LSEGRFQYAKENTRDVLVGASRFEPETSCAQASRAISWKSFLFNRIFENKRVSKEFGSGTIYDSVAPHAWSPLSFPLSEDEAKFLQRFPPLSRNQTLRFGDAKVRVQALGESWPGEYVIHDEATGERISIILGETTN